MPSPPKCDAAAIVDIIRSGGALVEIEQFFPCVIDDRDANALLAAYIARPYTGLPADDALIRNFVLLACLPQSYKSKNADVLAFFKEFGDYLKLVCDDLYTDPTVYHGHAIPIAINIVLTDYGVDWTPILERPATALALEMTTLLFLLHPKQTRDEFGRIPEINEWNFQVPVIGRDLIAFVDQFAQMIETGEIAVPAIPVALTAALTELAERTFANPTPYNLALLRLFLIEMHTFAPVDPIEWVYDFFIRRILVGCTHRGMTYAQCAESLAANISRRLDVAIDPHVIAAMAIERPEDM